MTKIMCHSMMACFHNRYAINLVYIFSMLISFHRAHDSVFTANVVPLNHFQSIVVFIVNNQRSYFLIMSVLLAILFVSSI